jgi:hypothetical protein
MGWSWEKTKAPRFARAKENFSVYLVIGLGIGVFVTPVVFGAAGLAFGLWGALKNEIKTGLSIAFAAGFIFSLVLNFLFVLFSFFTSQNKKFSNILGLSCGIAAVPAFVLGLFVALHVYPDVGVGVGVVSGFLSFLFVVLFFVLTIGLITGPVIGFQRFFSPSPRLKPGG